MCSESSWLTRRLQGKPPCSDLFGVKRRKWLRSLSLPVEEAETVQSALRPTASGTGLESYEWFRGDR
jgi:hypothetical protein